MKRWWTGVNIRRKRQRKGEREKREEGYKS